MLTLCDEEIVPLIPLEHLGSFGTSTGIMRERAIPHGAILADTTATVDVYFTLVDSPNAVLVVVGGHQVQVNFP
jgi:hypothetical protein